MTREWKAGDVASYDDRLVFVVGQGTDELKAIDCDGDERTEGVWIEARPLLVIDPEDREQVGRLVGLAGLLINPDNVQAALRTMLEPPAPPKPNEPTGLGAVVQDVDGNRVTRFDAYEGTDSWVSSSGSTWQWSEINVARILSPGITPDGPEAKAVLPPDLIDINSEDDVWRWGVNGEGYSLNDLDGGWYPAVRTRAYVDRVVVGPLREVPHGTAVTG